MRRVLLLLLVAFAATAGTLKENVATPVDAQQTYTLFLPSSYDGAKKLPLLLIFDPRGRGTVAAKIFEDAAEEYGWILISSNGTRSDESWEPNERALRALWPEVARYSADPRRLYATGFSGTAMAAWLLGIRTGALAGVIGVGGRLVGEVPPKNFSFAHYGFAGDIDFNNRDMRAIDALLAKDGKVHRFRSFEGPHGWMPPELARDALGWFELNAMKQQRRPRDEALIAKLYERELADAKSLRDQRALLETFDGLRNVDDVRANLARLERDPATLRALQEEAKWDAFEVRYGKETLDRIPQIFREMRASGAPGDGGAPEAHTTPERQLLREFRIAELKHRATREGAEGAAAQRLLETVHAQMAFYLMRDLMQRREYRLAAAALTVATEIHPDHAVTWYNLAAAYARMNDRRAALDALAKAFEHGYRDVEALAKDEDFASLRADTRFQQILRR